MMMTMSPSADRVDLPLSGKVAIVTGASSGIGKAIAQELRLNGARVAIGARNKDRLQEAAEALNKIELPSTSTTTAGDQSKSSSPSKRQKVGASTSTSSTSSTSTTATGASSSSASAGSADTFWKPVDVANRAEMKAFVTAAQEAFDGAPVDIMVNCAGVMYFTQMKNLHEDEWERTVDVNCKGTMNGVGAVLDGMVKQGKGHIINISSDASKRVFPSLAVYCASKTFIDVMSEGLRRELVGTGVRVTCIQPGDVGETNLVMNNTDQSAASGEGIEVGAPVGKGWATEYNVLQPKDVADAVVYAVTRPPRVAVNEVMVEPRDQT